jgi:predicted protein tyrosine phosphatase
MEFLITNRFVVENKFPKTGEPLGLISIKDPTEKPIDHFMSHVHGETCAILNLTFHDVDSLKIANDYKLSAFTPEMAKEILNWTKALIKAEIELIIVQCNAGISRSSGVAAALSLIINGDDSWIFDDKRYLPNRLVYRTILQIYDNLSARGWVLKYPKTSRD